ncbi:MAG: archease [archaeon]
MKYKFIEDLTSDVLFEARGKTLNELFENAALAMFDVICKVDMVGEKKKIKVEVKAGNLDDLMFQWLQHLIALVDIEEMFFSRFEVEEINDNKLIAYVYGEEISPAKGNTVVKSVTNYGFKLWKEKSKYFVTVSLDI